MRASRPLLLATALLCLAACGDQETRTDDYKIGRDPRYQNGSVASERGGIVLFGDRDSNKNGGTPTGLTVNAYLWRASLDTLSFMPIASADPFGGTILTDWYTPPATPGERVKVNVFVLGRELRADGVRVTVFRQVTANGVWQDAPTNAATAGTLEDAILTKARQLRVKALGEGKK